MSWPMCKADFKKHHAEDQTVFFSHTQKGPCFLCGEPGYFVMRWPDLGRLVKKRRLAEPLDRSGRAGRTPRRPRG